MKFIKIVTNHTKEEIDAIFSKFSSIDKQLMEDFYSTFKHNNFIDSNDSISMYAVIDSSGVDKLLKVYTDNSISFTYTDLTKQVLYGQVKSTGFIFDSFINDFINDFIDKNITVDIILEKITELGKDSLNEKDLSILKSF